MPMTSATYRMAIFFVTCFPLGSATYASMSPILMVLPVGSPLEKDLSSSIRKIGNGESTHGGHQRRSRSREDWMP
jgi:hypothetical protein